MFEVTSAILFFLLIISVYYNYKFGIIILGMVDALEESLDLLDEKYKIFSKIIEKPVFFDSLEIRQVIQEIKECQDLILSIANKISTPGRSQNEEEQR